MDEERPPSANPIVALLASSAGLSGLVVVVGFFIRQGVHSIIGVSARRSTDVSAYVVDAAYFVEDTLGSIFDHAKEIVIALVFVAGLLFIASRIVRRVPELMRQRRILFGIVIAVALLKLFYIDWPVVLISDFFRRPPVESVEPADFHAPSFLESRTRDMWVSVLWAHALEKPLHHRGRDDLEDGYALYIAAGLAIIGACLALLRAKRDDLYASAAVIVAIAQLFLMAYAYGKFEQSTFYPCVALTLREPANPPTQNAIMMSEDGGTVTVFDAKDDHFHRISWSEIREIVLLEENDVVLAHMLAVPPAASANARDRIQRRHDDLRRNGKLPRCLD